MMFKLANATVHYGSSSYPLNGLENKFDVIQTPEDLDLDALTAEVGHLTGFPREFTKSHCTRMEFTKERDGIELVMPERIVAIANGYTITWNKVH